VTAFLGVLLKNYASKPKYINNPAVQVDIVYHGNNSTAVDSSYRLTIKPRPKFST